MVECHGQSDHMFPKFSIYHILDVTNQTYVLLFFRWSVILIILDACRSPVLSGQKSIINDSLEISLWRVQTQTSKEIEFVDHLFVCGSGFHVYWMCKWRSLESIKLNSMVAKQCLVAVETQILSFAEYLCKRSTMDGKF